MIFVLLIGFGVLALFAYILMLPLYTYLAAREKDAGWTLVVAGLFLPAVTIGLTLLLINNAGWGGGNGDVLLVPLLYSPVLYLASYGAAAWARKTARR